MEGESSEQVQRLAVVGLPGALPLETLAWPPAERIACLLHLAAAGIVEALALREPVPGKAIGVLVGALSHGWWGWQKQAGAPSASWRPSASGSSFVDVHWKVTQMVIGQRAPWSSGIEQIGRGMAVSQASGARPELCFPSGRGLWQEPPGRRKGA